MDEEKIHLKVRASTFVTNIAWVAACDNRLSRVSLVTHTMFNHVPPNVSCSKCHEIWKAKYVRPAKG